MPEPTVYQCLEELTAVCETVTHTRLAPLLKQAHAALERERGAEERLKADLRIILPCVGDINFKQWDVRDRLRDWAKE